jgi:hypothetical protein
VVARAADLCAPGWHICQSASEVDEELDGQACSPLLPGFFASQQGTIDSNACLDGWNCGTNSRAESLELVHSGIDGCAPELSRGR